MRLAGKAALVTGGSRSIGRAIALAFGREGASVAVNYHQHRDSADAAVQAIEATGQAAFAVQADVRRGTDITAMIDQVVSRFGRLDILVNNAGILKRTPLLEISEEEWDDVLGTNLKGYFLCSQAAARVMIPQNSGAIVNISSANQEVASRNLAHYVTAKGGVRMLTRQLAFELAPHGIRVNAIAPGLTETDLNRDDLSDPAFRQYRIDQIPLGLIGQPEDIAGAAVYLASDEARMATGTTIFLDAGQTVV
ncbi:MAG TPA: glucose 1-dehydrogenase [Thermomicrobiaceae bacterium]|nr:glucose 1-dehydrogenase [Thermomicrobiaceae bacterium]